MGAGKYRDRVRIQRPGPDQDEIGQPLPASWLDVVTDAPDGKFAADIRYLRGMESIKAGAPTSAVGVSISLRYQPAMSLGIDAGMRIVDGDTVFDIKAVLPDKAKKKHVDLVCEVVNG